MSQNLNIKEIFEQDRPYEKFEQLGAAALTDAELLAIILRSGTKGVSSLELSQMILSKCTQENGLSVLFHMSLKELESFPGIGSVKAIQLKCICEISKRISQGEARRALVFNRPSSIAGYYMETLRHEEQEHVYCMMFDSKNALLSDECITKGTVNEAILSPRELYVRALSNRAVSIALVHNHPSGDPSPSREDVDTTQRIYNAGKMIGIPLLDHIIIGANSYTSIIAEEALIEL